MSIVRIANRFAVAILDAMPADADREVLFRDFADVLSSVRKSRDLLMFFQSPVISQARKLEAIDALFTGRVGPFVLSVLRFLVEKEREEYILEIFDALFDLRRQREGIISTSVHSAVELSEGQRAALQTALERVSGKRVEAEYAIDADLMGGVTVRLGDTVYDGSVQHQLKRLRARFVGGR
jgi:F-type H+-transporting ATPase subunit delta